ncbi:transmembrane protein 161B [Phlebotomus argentipes]|uniref:transmembrane protein 161B n=1 Tax=Phlebotomus argentipes TaxID=94469 RepID=UPI0028932527|nr:transmembrane protein 161B [Phlebotomus argentipes]
MALLGAQLVITLVMVSLMQKLSPHFSLAKWILCSTGLTRYLYPSDSELKSLAGVPKGKGKSGNRQRNGAQDGEKSNVFHVPQNLNIQLETAKISALDVVHLRYYTEYQWLVDFSLYSAVVYVISEVVSYFIPPKDEVNLSMMWCLLVIFFAFRLLVSLTVQYFRSEESIGERSTCIVTGFSYLLVAMMVLIVDESTLEVGLDRAYRVFNESASVFLESQGIASSGPASKIIVKFCIAVMCGLLGAVFTFPGLRMARMHWDLLKYCQENRLLQVLLNVNFALPFVLVIMWVKPISRDYLTERVFRGLEAPLMTPHAFETTRLILVVIVVVLRFVLMPFYLQAYLNLAHQRIEDQKKEVGRITNVDLQRKVASIFYYLCVVTVQYAAPVIMCLYLALMYKTMGGYRWSSLFRAPVDAAECPAEDLLPTTPEPSDEGIMSSAKAIQLSLRSLKNVFNEDVYRGLFGFATWWSCFAWFAATSLGMIYQSYFDKN